MPATSSPTVTMTLDFTYQGKQQSQYLIIMKVVIVLERDINRGTVQKKRVIPNTRETQKMMFHRISIIYIEYLFSVY